MAVYLGNLTTLQLQERLGITLTNEELDTLESMRQDRASNVSKDKWHCFDIPFTLVAGSMETATKVYQILLPYNDQMKNRLQISISGA